MKKILVLHVYEGFAPLFQGWLGSTFEVKQVTSAVAAKESIHARRPDLLIVQLGTDDAGLLNVKFLRDKTNIGDLPIFYISAKVVGESATTDDRPILGIPTHQDDFVNMVERVLKQTYPR